jgi:nucleoside-diphosphate-sugar epimerase
VRVFLTGASGLIGGAVARALVADGHQVLGLARSPKTARHLVDVGVDAMPGSLEDHDSLRRAARASDAVIHAAFPRDAMADLPRAAELERAAVRAMLALPSVAQRPFLYTSGLGVVGDTAGRRVTEDTEADPPPGLRWRRDLELTALALAHGIVIRPPMVYGDGGGVVFKMMIRTARERGGAAYVAPGDNTWPNVHVDDLARAYVLALARAEPGALFHVVGGESTPRAVAEAIGRLIGRPDRTEALSIDEGRRAFSHPEWLMADVRVDARRVREVLGWSPVGPDLVDDIETGSYRTLLTD